MMEFIDDAVVENRDAVEYFRIGKTPYIIKSDKIDLEKSILDIQSYFILEELYEEAARCNSIIDRHRVNLLMDLLE